MKIWDIDADGEVTALGDGYMMYRYLLGIRGALLIFGAVDPVNAVRKTVAEIEGYLEQIRPYMDVDGDGEATEKDGLLILRLLFGFTGPTLTDSVIVAGALRNTSDELVEYKNKMVAES